MRFTASLAGTLLASSAAFAQEAPKGMPQLDFHNPLTISQVVWLALIFLALYLLLSRWALPQVADVLELRAGTIGRDLEAARAAKAQADAAVAELTSATRAAQAGAQAEIAAAVAAAKQAAGEQAARLNARLEAQLHTAETQIAAARDAAMGALRQVAGETAGVVVTKLTGMVADAPRVEAAVAAAMAARKLSAGAA
ncbi:MAG: F0F1 ATP synthase subunit B' [Rhodospirillales bacterium]|nr:F0F1 ATP synthase subunit B' [Rhodospirillales bacterium]MDE2198225.1 F0F1 ATP synthase subunit B' [Rhodospirillales bacterium]MDE2574987.1 F0F1 ATP synthase subunit B' [Rhodospirillales bacterium]